MHVISRPTLIAFWSKHSDAEQSLKAWHAEAAHSAWTCPNDIRQRYRSVDFLPDHRVVFNIKGDRYRLVVRINYDSGTVFICFVGTHAEYDRIDAETI